MKTNAAGITLIEEFEGLRLKPYRCQAGKPTIGFGHVILPAESHLMRGITRAQAEALLDADLGWAEAAVTKWVRVPLTGNQFSALVSWTYNVGAGGLRSSTLLRLLNRRDYAGAADQFAAWNKVAGLPSVGLTRRRAAERALFLTPERTGVA